MTLLPQNQTRIFLIAAVSANNIIGNNNKLPWKNKTDMGWFKKKTTGHTVVMGRKTFESLKCKPLDNRRNVVISSSLDKDLYAKQGVVVYKSVEDYLSLDVDSESQKNSTHWICGGANLYNQLYPFCQLAYVTKIQKKVIGDTTFIPKDIFKTNFKKTVHIFEHKGNMSIIRYQNINTTQTFPDINDGRDFEFATF